MAAKDTKDYTEMCKQILTEIGGRENIANATHCATRLRFNLKDKSAADPAKLKAINGVAGAQFSGDQLQVIIGLHVQNVFDQFCTIAGIGGQTAGSADKAEEVEQAESGSAEISKTSSAEAAPKARVTPKSVLSAILDAVTGCVFPILPLMTAAGMFKLIPTLLGSSMLGLVADDNIVMQIFAAVGNAGFYFFPIFVGYSASKKFKTNTAVSMFLCALLLYTTYTDWVAAGEAVKVFGISIPLVSYSSQFLPSILIVWVYKYIEKLVNKIIPQKANLMLAPFVGMLIMLPLEFFLLAPAGYYAGVGIMAGLNGLYTVLGPVAVGLAGGLWQLLVATGMHQAMIPLMIQNVMTNGYDMMLSVGSTIAAYALMGTAVAYIIRSKPGDEKALAVTNGLTLILGGMSELTIFSCMLRYRTALVATITGGFVGGILAGTMGVKFTLMGPTAFYTVISFSGEKFVQGLICCAVAFAISFGMCMVMGFREKDTKKAAAKKQTKAAAA